MQSTLTNQQIYSYLQSLHIKISSQSSLREMDPSILWSTLTTLAWRIELQSVTSTIALLGHQIQDPQRHTRSLQWVSSKLLLSTLYRALGLQFKIMHYFKPQKDKMHAILSRVVSACMWSDRVRQDNDALFVRSACASKELMRVKMELEDAVEMYAEMQRRKKEEEPLYRQYIVEMEQQKEEIMGYRSRGLEGEREIKDMEEERERLEKKNERSKYEICEKEIEIVRLSKEIASNAPEIKKERIILEEQYHNMEEQYSNKKKIMIQKKYCFNESLNATRRHYSKIEKYKNIIHTLNTIEEQNNIQNQLIQMNNNLKEQVSVLSVEDSRYQEQLKRQTTEQMQLFNQAQNVGCKMSEVENGLQKITIQMIKTSERITKLKEYQLQLNRKNKELEDRMQGVINSSMQQLQQIERQLREKCGMVHDALQQLRRDLVI